MAEHDLQELVAAAHAYEALHVPALFSEWAPRVLDAASVRADDRLLDIACGTGVLAREAARRVGASRVTGVDPNPGMLAVASEMLPGASWRRGGAESLPVADDESFDAVVSQFGMMFFDDRERALGEIRRVLAPGGRVAIAVWAGLADSPAYAAEVDMLERLAGPDAANALRAPFVLGDPDELRRIFIDADLTGASVAQHSGTARFPSVRSMVEADLRGWLPVMGVSLSDETIAEILADSEEVLAPWVTASGSVEFESPALIASWRAD